MTTEVPRRRRLYQTPDAPEAPLPPGPRAPAASREGAEQIVHTHVYMTLAASMVPLPLLDALAVSAIQIDMASELAAHYGRPFDRDRAKAVVAALLGSFGAMSVGRGILMLVLGPILHRGLPLYVASSALAASAATYALGRVFVHHYELGGTLLDLDPEKTRSFFLSQVDEGRKVAAAALTP